VPILWTIVLSRDFTPLAWIVAWTAGLVVGACGRRHFYGPLPVGSLRTANSDRRAAWFALLTLLGLDIVWRWANVYSMFVGQERQVASARYETILLVPFAIGMALLIQAVLRPTAGGPAAGVFSMGGSPLRGASGQDWSLVAGKSGGLRRTRLWVRVGLVAAFIVFTAATFQRPYETLLRPFTVDYEYRFLKRQALTLPAGSHLYVFDSPIDDTGFIDAHLVGQFVRSAVSFGSWSERDCDALLHDSSPAYLYIGSSCAALSDAPERPLPASYGRWLDECAAMRERFGAEPVEQIEVPAHKMSWHDFKERTVRIALFRLTEPTICAVGPRSHRE